MEETQKHRGDCKGNNAVTKRKFAICDGKKRRNFAFTSYNGKVKPDKVMKYLVQGDEICPTTGKEHIQGFMILKNGKTLKEVYTDKRWKGLYWEYCYCDEISNSKYCKKDGEYECYGEAPVGKGARTDIRRVVSSIEAGDSDGDIIRNFGDASLRMYKSIGWARQALHEKHGRRRTDEPRVLWIWGGKSRERTKCIKDNLIENDKEVYWKDNSKWWDGYNYEEVVIIKNIELKKFGEGFFRLLIEGDPLKVETKGGSIEFNSDWIIVTCDWDLKSEVSDGVYGEVSEIVKEYRLHEVTWEDIMGNDI